MLHALHALAWNREKGSNILVPRLHGRRVYPLMQPGYKANVAKSDGVIDLGTQSSTWQCDQPWIHQVVLCQDPTR